MPAKYNREGDNYAWVIAGVGILVVMGAIGLARFGYTLILPRMSTALQLSETGSGGVATANLVGYLLFSLAGGVLATRYSPRKVIVVSLVITGAALCGSGLSKDLPTAALWRFLAGAGGGANVPMMGLVSAWFSSRRRGLASGIIVSGSSFALLLTGVTLPPVMTANAAAGWKHAWYILGATTIIIAIVSLLVLKDAPPGAPRPARGQKRQSTRIAKLRRAWPLAGLYMLFGFSYVIFATFFARYLSSEAMLAEKTVGGLWSLIGGVSIASGFLWGAVSDRFGRKAAFAWIFALQAATYLVFALWQAMPGYILATLLFALTAWSIPAVMGAAVGDTFGPAAAPAVLGFVTLIFGIGQSLGPLIAGAVADSSGTYKFAFLLAAGAALIGVPVSLLIRTRYASQTDFAPGAPTSSSLDE
ncbi:MAG: YbfB/YjiJ family MFS transporter [Spirochaetales bacterium]|nr:YbfB/YjiJ family MFS transporter [Spirochaetales bacterium]